MATNAKQELVELVDRLSDAEADEALTAVRRVIEGRAARPDAWPDADLPVGLVRTGRIDPRRPRHAVPILQPGRRIAADELRADIFPSGETPEEFEAAIRRWREEPEGG